MFGYSPQPPPAKLRCLARVVPMHEYSSKLNRGEVRLKLTSSGHCLLAYVGLLHQDERPRVHEADVSPRVGRPRLHDDLVVGERLCLRPGEPAAGETSNVTRVY
ncbi:hypothetical protein NOR_02873 [Metarhizium rileyi]|uniref:Uncharacterized protein n=1 Tax=Metarhizium rileyi (strain RCEF 4871) TaxID=1649241 RepID=A0A162LWR9_METRR|nr:hypothetical protein NOR_02873 [Metarhizium rileyi RCEF 4871]